MSNNNGLENQTIKINDIRYSLNDLEILAWKKLITGAVKKKNGFRTMCVATITSNTSAALRMVVNRKVDEVQKIIYFHTDNRSRKFQDLLIDNRLTLLFYDAKQRIQIVAYATAQFHTNDAVAQDRWRATGAKARLSYMTIDPPNTRSNEATLGYDDRFAENLPTDDESNLYQKNFSVVACYINQLEFLYLNFTGNYKANFYYQASGCLERLEWAVP